MEALVLIVVLGATVLVGTTLGGRYRVAPPVLLIAFGRAARAHAAAVRRRPWSRTWSC